MNGKEQMMAMAELAKPWQPKELGGFQVGDAVRLPSIDCIFEVTGLADPFLVLRSPSGREVKAGWRAAERVRQKTAS